MLGSSLAADEVFRRSRSIWPAVVARIRDWADKPQVVVDIFRIEAGKLAEHWDVLRNELPVANGGISMFDPDEGAFLERPQTA